MEEMVLGTTSIRYFVSGLIALASILGLAASGWAAPGDLDPTFGFLGVVVTAIGDDATAYGLVRQSDGKLVVAGQAFVGGNYDFALARYNPDGSLDPSFGSGGVVVTTLGPENDSALSLAIQTDGKLVAAGYSTVSGRKEVALARYETNGALDTTFGNGGVVVTAVGLGDSEVRDVVLQGDGNLLASGYALGPVFAEKNFITFRYLSSGAPDTSFGFFGQVSTAITSGDDFATALALQPDGKIVVAGSSLIVSLDTFSTEPNFALTRYTTLGSIDTSFGSGGIVNTRVSNSFSFAEGIALQADGKIVVVGHMYDLGAPGYDYGVVRYNPSGGLDQSFGNGGSLRIAPTTLDDFAFTVLQQRNGALIVGGLAQINPGENAFTLVRLTASGSLDPTFGTGGFVFTPFGGDAAISDTLLDPTGRLVAAGSADHFFALARYDVEICGNGTLDAGEDCDDGDLVNTNACKNDCTVNVCGDGVTGGLNEQCDDGNADNGDTCIITNSGAAAGVNNCVSARCGDSFVRIGVEQCDDGNSDNSDGCIITNLGGAAGATNCVNATCGDGFRCSAGGCHTGPSGGVEQCDDHNNVTIDDCRNDCGLNVCGDGATHLVTTGTPGAGALEGCDDFNTNNNDSCIITNPGGPVGATNCAAAACGDGFQCTGLGCITGRDGGPEACEDGNTVDGDGCDSNCSITACGNGIQSLGESCDDDNLIAGDGCSPTCATEPGWYCSGTPSLCATMCGDGIAAGTELCDDHNAADGDGCDSNCTPTGCGNGIATAGEPCDDGNADNADGCVITQAGGPVGPTNCAVARCGDHHTCTSQSECDTGPHHERQGNQPERCDLGDDLNNAPYSGCAPDCSAYPVPACKRRLSSWSITAPNAAMTTGVKAKSARVCRDGDATCDGDATVDGVCTFAVDMCLMLRSATAGCNPAAVESIDLGSPDLGACWRSHATGALSQALAALDPQQNATVFGRCANAATAGRLCPVGNDASCNGANASDGICGPGSVIVFNDLLPATGDAVCTQSSVPVTVPAGRRLRVVSRTWGYTARGLQPDADRLTLVCRAKRGSTVPPPTTGPCPPPTPTP